MKKPPVRKGRVLRIKQGYNPNSSSMGSIVLLLPSGVILFSAVSAAASGIITSVFLKNKSSDDKKHSNDK